MITTDMLITLAVISGLLLGWWMRGVKERA